MSRDLYPYADPDVSNEQVVVPTCGPFAPVAPPEIMADFEDEDEDFEDEDEDFEDDDWDDDEEDFDEDFDEDLDIDDDDDDD